MPTQQSFFDAVEKASSLSYKDKLKPLIADAQTGQSRSSSKMSAFPNPSTQHQEQAQTPTSSRRRKSATPTVQRPETQSIVRRGSVFMMGPSATRTVQRSLSLAEPGGSSPKREEVSVSRPRAGMISRRRSTDGDFAGGPRTPTPSRLGRGLGVAGRLSLHTDRTEACDSPLSTAGSMSFSPKKTSNPGTPEKKPPRNSWTLLPGMPHDDGSAKKLWESSTAGIEWLTRMKMARDMNVSVETVQEAHELFTAYAKGAEKLTLTKESFLNVLCHLTNHTHVEDLPYQLVEQTFKFCNLAGDGGCVDFTTFLSWFSTQSFREDVLLQGVDLERRNICREGSFRFNMPLCEVEQYRRYFEKFDVNKNGVIDPEEFEHVVRKCAKLPGNVEIPELRLKQLWSECDVNKNGKIDFEEFLSFFSKHFDAGGAGFAGYYRGIRTIPGWTDNVN